MAERESLSTQMAAWAQVVSALVGFIAAVAAVIVGLRTLDQGEKQRHEAQTQQTLQFFASFNAADMLETRELLDNEDWCARYNYVPAPNYVSEVKGAHIVSIVDFFDAVNNSCPPENETADDENADTVCDRAFAESLFSPYAKDLYDNLSRDILERRQQRGSNNFGSGMAVLAGEANMPLEDVVARYAQDSCGVPAGAASGARVNTPPANGAAPAATEPR